jgi:tetratricopeptide (TPR) repeat protein
MRDANKIAAPALAIMKLLEARGDYSLSLDERRQQKQKVIDACRLAAEADPADAFLTYLYGLSLYRADNLPGAAEILERLDNLEIKPGMELYEYLLGKCYNHHGCDRPDDAHVRYKKIAQRIKDQEAWIRGGFTLAPDSLIRVSPSAVCREVGESLASRGDDADAERCLRLALDLESDWVNHWKLGHFLLERERSVEAEAAFRRSDEIRHDMASVNMIGRCLHGQGRFAEAESAYRLALTLEDNLAGDFIEAAVHNNLGYLLLEQDRFDQAAEEFNLAIATNYAEDPEMYLYGLVLTLYRAGKDADAEAAVAQWLKGDVGSLDPKHSARIFNLLGDIRLKHRDRWLDALAMFGESIRRDATVPEAWANLARAQRRLKLHIDALCSLDEALRLDPDNEVFKQRQADVRSGNPFLSTYYESFYEFVQAGKVWLDSAKWLDPGTSSLLRVIYNRNLRWANNRDEFPFIEYEIDADFLDESLARAESLKELIRYEIESPVLLETPELFIAMERDGNMLRSFVAAGEIGVAVSVNLTNWDLYYESEDSDAMFAAGASLNFFIDCSMDLSLHPKYERVANTATDVATMQLDAAARWTTNVSFVSDVEGIREGRLNQPPKAHRVKGFIRKLTERHPTDAARDRAPAFIRRNMGPDDTFVRPHQRGGGNAAERLFTRLRTHSSLADFLATAPRW